VICSFLFFQVKGKDFLLGLVIIKNVEH